MTLVLNGTGVTDGIAIGTIHQLSSGELELPEYHLEEAAVDREIERLQRAVGRCERMLEQLVGRLRTDAADPAVELLDAHRLMVRDELLLGETVARIRSDHINAEWALDKQAVALRKQFRRMDDAYLAMRVEDLDQVVRLIQRELADQPPPVLDARTPHQLDETVVLAPELSPADLAVLHQRRVAGLITEHGGIWAHSAIVARALEIPMVVAVRPALRVLTEGEPVILDGHYGVVMATRDSGLHQHYAEKLQASRQHRVALRRHLDEPDVTRDGFAFGLYGNAQLPEEIERCYQGRAAGIGLMRTEFLLSGGQIADEESQYQAYAEAVRRMHGRPVTIRTLDAGGDKLPEELARVRGPNPALGLRGIRLSLAISDSFRPQIRAILRASREGPVRILLPMLTGAAEVRQAREIIAACRDQLIERGERPDPEIAVGGMIETPAAALIIPRLAADLDFLSVGTNDLIQYVLAVDRQDERVSHLYEPTHPAVLDLLGRVVADAGAAGRPLEVCGEMAGDPAYLRLLLGLGLTGFSMPPGQLPEAKARLRGSHAGRCREIVAAHLEQADPPPGAELLRRLEADGG